MESKRAWVSQEPRGPGRAGALGPGCVEGSQRRAAGSWMQRAGAEMRRFQAQRLGVEAAGFGGGEDSGSIPPRHGL